MENLETCSVFSCHVKNLWCTPCTGLSPGLNCGCGCGDNRDRTFSVWNDQKVMIIIPRDFNYLSHLMPSAKQSEQLSNDIGISVSCVNIMWCQCDQSFVPRELISPLSGVISPSWSADGLQMTWCTIIVTSPMRNSDQAHFYWLLATSQKLNCQISSESLWCANWNIWCDNAIFIKQIIGIFELAHLAVTISTLDRKGFEFRVLNLLLLTIIWRFLVEKYL